MRLVTQCSVQSISVQLCFDSEKQRSFPTIKFTFIVIYTYIIIIIILTTQVRKVSIFPIPKKWQICCNQIIKAGENLFFLYFIMIKTEFTFLTYGSVKKYVVIYDTLIYFKIFWTKGPFLLVFFLVKFLIHTLLKMEKKLTKSKERLF